MISIQYLAGFIDGEGSIVIGKSGPPRPDGVQSSFSATLMIANTHLPSLQAIQAQYGGRIDSNGKPDNPAWKPGWSLIWKGPAALDIIQAIRPYLLIKSEQADVAVEFGRLQRASYRRKKSDDEIAAAHLLRDTMKALNARGRPEAEA